MDEVGLGKQLQRARQKAGFTQQELCHKADISYSTLAKIERGAIKAPSIFTIERIASALGQSLDQLLGREVAMRPGLPPIVPKKVSKTGVRFVYFDINGCLLGAFRRAYARLSEETNTSLEQVEALFWRYDDAVCRGDLGIEEFNEILSQSLNTPDIDWMTYYMEEVEPVTEMQELLLWAQEYYHVGLMTNTMPGFVNEMLRRKLIPNIPYSAIIDSSQVGAIKPEEEIYKVALAQSNYQPNEILLVDDTRVNVMTAEDHGWNVLWFDILRPEESANRLRKVLEFED